MAERNYELSRRQFLGAALAGIAGALVLKKEFNYFIEPLIEDSPDDFLKDIQEASYLPEELIGTGFNTPFLWARSKSTRDNYLESAKNNGQNIHRLNLDFNLKVFQKSLGVYNTEVLDDVETLVDESPPENTFIIPILDGYKLRENIPNAFYANGPINSPYLEDTSSIEATLESQLKFMTGDTYRKYYDERVAVVVDRFKNKPNVLLEIGNEIAVPYVGVLAREINTKWYEKSIKTFRDNGYKKTLLTGTSDPDLIDYNHIDTEMIVGTDHPYYAKDVVYPQKVPIILEEIGFPHRLFNKVNIPDYDRFLTNLIWHMLKKSIVHGVGYTGCVVAWQADPDHKDNFDFNETSNPLTLAFLNRLAPRLKIIFAN